MNEKSQETFRQLLMEEFQLAKQKNSSYSLRAYSRQLGLSSSALSEILNGKRNVSKKNASRILSKSRMSAEKKEDILDTFEHSKRRVNRQERQRRQLRIDQQEMLTDWEHFAIMSLMRTAHEKASIQWIADRLNISEKRAAKCTDRLVRLGFIDQTGMGLILNEKDVSTSDGISSHSLKTKHQQILEQAIAKLFKTRVDARDYLHLTMAVDPSKLDRARAVTRKYLSDMEDLLEDGPNEEVYCLAVQLFPLTEVGLEV